MRLATIRRGTTTWAARIDDDRAVEIEGFAGLGELLSQPGWAELAASASGESAAVEALDYAPLVPRPDKIVCVGLNYRAHILETGREPPEYPTLFAKFRSALVGAHDDIALPAGVRSLDWEAELGIVVGTPVRGVSEAEARAAIAGYTVLNDVTARDWQGRTLQWLQGKTFEGTTPLGPWLVTSDEMDGTRGRIGCSVNGSVMQDADISDLVFGPATLVAYISQVVTLLPGDVIATGTPSGIGAGRTPPVFLNDGDVVTTRIEGVGECLKHGAGSVVIEGAAAERLGQTLPWMDRGTGFFAVQLASLGDDELMLPSALPGWSRLHVVSHMARNARALMNLLRWAETGVESPMYPSPRHRRDDIEAGAQLPAAEVRADAIAEADRFRRAVSAMPDGAWNHEVRTALGRPVLACEVPWMRVREVWVHAVDLAAGATFADLDADVARALFDEAVDRLAGHDECPPLTFVVEGAEGERRSVGPDAGDGLVASGSARALAGWLLGRTGGAEIDCTGPLPDLPAWL